MDGFQFSVTSKARITTLPETIYSGKEILIKAVRILGRSLRPWGSEAIRILPATTSIFISIAWPTKVTSPERTISCNGV